MALGQRGTAGRRQRCTALSRGRILQSALGTEHRCQDNWKTIAEVGQALFGILLAGVRL